MRDLEREIQIAEAITADLKSYLLSDVLYMELPKRGILGAQFPKGTLGGLLLRLDLLNELRGNLSSAQQGRVERVRQQTDELLRHWAIQAEQKAVREVSARLRTFENFLEESEQDPARHNTEYVAQVEGRIIIEYLRGYAGQHIPDTMRGQIAAVDRRLDRISEAGDFVWSDDQRSAFPQDRFPWLYLRLK